MERTNVESTQIRSIGWDNGTLEIEFNSGGIYHYSAVPKSKYEELVSSKSVGKYFGANIKLKYEFEKIN